MGLLTRIIDEREDKKRAERNAQLEMLKVALPRLKPQDQEFALEHLFKTAGIKGPERDVFTTLLKPLLHGAASLGQKMGVPGAGALAGKTASQPQQAQPGGPGPMGMPDEHPFYSEEELEQQQSSRKISALKQEEDIKLQSKVKEDQYKLAIDAAKKKQEQDLKQQDALWRATKAKEIATGPGSADEKRVQLEAFMGSKTDRPPTLSADEKLARDANVPVSTVAAARLGKLQADSRKAIAKAGGVSSSSAPSTKAAAVRTLAANDPAMDLAAWDYLGGRMVSLGIGKEAGIKKWQIVQRADELFRRAGFQPSDIVTYRPIIKANSAALAKITTQGAQIEQFEGTLKRNIEIARKLSAAFDRGDIRLYNRVLEAYKTGTGDSEALNLATQLHGVAREWGKIMAGSTSASGVPVSEANAADLFFKYLSDHQINDLFDKVVIPDAGNRSAAIEEEQKALIDKIKSSGKPATSDTPPKVKNWNPEKGAFE